MTVLRIHGPALAWIGRYMGGRYFCHMGRQRDMDTGIVSYRGWGKDKKIALCLEVFRRLSLENGSQKSQPLSPAIVSTNQHDGLRLFSHTFHASSTHPHTPTYFIEVCMYIQVPEVDKVPR